jgi:glycosyltransferase involved in cell wall biosynthesis
MLNLCDLPVQLDIVGPIQIEILEQVRQSNRIRFHGPVPRSAVSRFYEKADLFVFPTRSDGFGLTQLEAISAGLPVIASRHCGEVVTDGENGRVLPDLSAAAIAGVLREIIDSPDKITVWRQKARLDSRFSLQALGEGLLELELRGASTRSVDDAAVIR